jgi:uncharacterized repeat protein (TIGR03806 family)
MLLARPLAVVAMAIISVAASRVDAGDGDAAQRISFSTGRVVGSPEPPPPYRLTRAFPDQTFKNPVHVVREPDSDRILVLELGGKIWAVEGSKRELFLDLPGELYGMTFHPEYARNGFVYIFNNTGVIKPQRNVVSRYKVAPDKPRKCDPASKLEVIAWESAGHDGGDLAFGPRDGLLYISAGDSTTSSDPKETGQDLSDLLSAMIRIDVDHPAPGKSYAIPPDNPFLKTPNARPEIWAYGFRNPWRFCFDRATNRLWMGDIGQDLWEMIELVGRGTNHGWSVKEGPADFLPARPKRGPTPFTPPVVVHHHSEARSITGGFVYDGDRFPDLARHYVYGDFATGRMWAFRYEGNRVVDHREIADSSVAMLGFCIDRAGDVYTADYNSGGIYRLERKPPSAEPTGEFPRRLTETGLFKSVREHVMAPGVIPYAVNSPLWSDGAAKARYLAMPGTSRAEFKPAIDEPWVLPEGTVLVKTFLLPTADSPAAARRIETRLLALRDKEWEGYSYLWNDDQSDAVLVGKGGLDRSYRVLDPKEPGGVREQTWHYPSRAECMVCHSRAAGFVLGLTTGQLNRDVEGKGQIQTFEGLGLFQKPPPKEGLPRLADPYDGSSPLEARSRSYLNTNCAICHVDGGGGNTRMQLRVTMPDSELFLFDQPPQHHSFGIKEARLVAPGHPERSVLLHRIATRGEGYMPPLATSVVDAEAVALIRAWIGERPEAAKPGSR